MKSLLLRIGNSFFGVNEEWKLISRADRQTKAVGNNVLCDETEDARVLGQSPKTLCVEEFIALDEYYF